MLRELRALRELRELRDPLRILCVILDPISNHETVIMIGDCVLASFNVICGGRNLKVRVNIVLRTLKPF